jgi:GGDEF domain-containing protein/DNA-binding response OmpR family regulator
MPAEAAAAAPLFILSFRHRDELTRLAERGGWQPIAARRPDNAESRFIASGASVAIVDARGALVEGTEAVKALGDPVEANAAALLVLLSRTDDSALEALYAAGATHFLVSPFSEQQLLQAILYAQRHAERSGGRRAVRAPDARGAEPPASWRWEPGSSTIELSPALARRAGLGESGGQRVSLMELFRRMDSDGRRAARGAVDRLLATGESTAFAHTDLEAEGGRLAHHLRVDEGQQVVGRTEAIVPLGGAPWQTRDPMTGVRDSRAARAWIDRQLATSEGHSPPLVTILLAVSRFDAINAAFGRRTGDAVLQAAARRIERLVDTDGKRRLVARLAGAEFAILLGGPTSLGEGRFLAGQLIEATGRPFAATMSSRSPAGPESSPPRRGTIPPRCSAAPAAPSPRPRRARRGRCWSRTRAR